MADRRVEIDGVIVTSTPLTQPFVYSGHLNHIPATIIVSDKSTGVSVSKRFVQRYNQASVGVENVFVANPLGGEVPVTNILQGSFLTIEEYSDNVDFDVIKMLDGVDVVLGYNWLVKNNAIINCGSKPPSITVRKGQKEITLANNISKMKF